MNTNTQLQVLAEKQNVLSKTDMLNLMQCILDIFSLWGVEGTLLTRMKVLREQFKKVRKSEMLEIIQIVRDALIVSSGTTEHVDKLTAVLAKVQLQGVKGVAMRDFLTTLIDENTTIAIDSASDPTGIEVDNGTAFENLPLPSTVTVTLINGKTAQVGVTWDEGDYDGDVADTYTLEGTLVLTPRISNPDEVTVTIDVTVAE